MMLLLDLWTVLLSLGWIYFVFWRAGRNVWNKCLFFSGLCYTAWCFRVNTPYWLLAVFLQFNSGYWGVKFWIFCRSSRGSEKNWLALNLNSPTYVFSFSTITSLCYYSFFFFFGSNHLCWEGETLYLKWETESISSHGLIWNNKMGEVEGEDVDVHDLEGHNV